MERNVSIPADLSSKVLTIGLPYIDFKGGISMIINTYSKYFQPFNFLSSYKRSSSKLITALYFPFFIMKFCSYLFGNKQIKIVHIHGAARGSLFRKSIVFIVAKYFFGKKVIFHSHGGALELFYEKSNWLIKKYIAWFFARVDLVICLSEKWESFFRENFHVKKIVILENIIDNNHCVAKEIKPGNEKITLLFMGKIASSKGIFDLLEVIAENKEYLTGKLSLLVAGRGDIKALEQYLDTEKLRDIVNFSGWSTGEKKNKLFAESDIYILPSYHEGLPVSILEAMSFRLPVIATNVGGIPEIVQNGKNGFLVCPGDKHNLFQKIKWFIENRNDIAGFGEASFKMVQPYYADAVIPRLTTVYNLLLQDAAERNVKMHTVIHQIK